MAAVRTVSCSICAADLPPPPGACARCGFDPAAIERLEAELVRLEEQRNWGIVTFVVGMVVSAVLYLAFGALGTLAALITLFAGPWRLAFAVAARVKTKRAIRAAYLPRELPAAKVVPR